MNLIKKIALFCLLSTLPAGAWAQATASRGIGLGVNFYSSNKFGGITGGIDYNSTSQLSFASKWQLLIESDIYFGYGGIGFKTIDDKGNYTKDENLSVFDVGLKYTIGVNFFIVPKQLSINAGPFISVGKLLPFGLSDNSVTTPYVKDNTTGSTVDINDLIFGMDVINYGVNVGGTYRFGKHQLGARFNLGLNELTPEYPGITTKASYFTINYGYLLADFSIAKRFQNKLLK